jgi:xylan 1,4-beta-xylosidase
MLWDHRPGQNRFAGIVVQEFSPGEQRLVGERRVIFSGTPLGLTEAPHVYKHDGFYHLIAAEGGTGWGHAVTMARARNLDGPYELHPDVYVLSARHRPDVALQRAGHADLVDTSDGSTYMVYLCGRPLPNRGRCTLGRETAIQKMVWGSDGWLRTVDGNGVPSIEVEAPVVAAQVASDPPPRENFDGAQLPIDFQWLRSPWPDELFSLTERRGFLRLYGRETLGSLFKQALVARRQQSHCYSASTIVEFEPRHFQQIAGLICYYNSSKFHYLHISTDERTGKHVRVMSALPDQPQSDAFTPPLPIRSGVPVELGVEVDYERLHFGYRVGSAEWTWIAQQFDASILSDEATTPGLPNFTGAFVGMACQDMSGARCIADFDWFEYVERPYRHDPFPKRESPSS